MKKILLIEDNEDIRNNTAEILELSNYEVITAENGKVGIEMAVHHVPDLIICDIMMPVLDGYGVLHAIQRNDALSHIPFIFLTAKTERTDFRRGMELGADDYITKPFNGTELLAAIDGRLKKIDLLKTQLSGLEGMEYLMEATSGKDALQEMIQDRDINKYKKKQVIYTEGNHPHRLYYVLKGKVKTSKANDDGKELIIDLYHTGDFLGHIALLEGTVYKESAEAMEETELAIIPKDDFAKLVYNNKEVARKFIQLLAKNVSEKENQLLGLAYNSLRKKVADALILFQKKYQRQDGENAEIDISREGLANIAGTATESLIRTLSDFRSEKLIDIKDGNIVVLNPGKLERLAN